MWSRSYETHISYKYIVELRKFVYIKFSHPSSKCCDSWIIRYFKEWTIFSFILCKQFSLLFLRIHNHRTKFIHMKNFPIFSNSFTFIKRIVFVLPVYEKCNYEEKRRKYYQSRKGNYHIK